MRKKSFLTKTLLALGSSLGGAVMVIMMNESVVEAQAGEIGSIGTVEPANAVVAALVACVVGIAVYIKRNKAK